MLQRSWRSRTRGSRRVERGPQSLAKPSARKAVAKCKRVSRSPRQVGGLAGKGTGMERISESWKQRLRFVSFQVRISFNISRCQYQLEP